MTTFEEAKSKFTPKQLQEREEQWLAVRKELEDFNGTLPPIPCDCGREVISTIFGCSFCADEYSESLRIELENPNFIEDRKKKRH